MKHVFLGLTPTKGDEIISVNMQQVGAMTQKSNGTELIIQGIKVMVREDMENILSDYNALLQ